MEIILKMNTLVEDFSNLNLDNTIHHHKKRRNKKKNENEKEKEEVTDEKKFKEEINEIKCKIRDFKNLFDCNETKNIYENKLENVILIDKLVNYPLVKQKLIECFNNENIFDYLFNIWKKILEFSGSQSTISTQDKNNENIIKAETGNEFEEKKENKNINKGLVSIFIQILSNLDFFIPKIINNTKDNSFKSKVIETIFPNIQFIKSIQEADSFLYYFTNIFNIKDEMMLKIEKEYQEQLNQIVNNNVCFGLNLINAFDLQEMFPLETIFKMLLNNYSLISYRIYSLLAKTYIRYDEQKKYLIIDKLFELIEENKNLIDFELVYNLVNNDFKNDEKRTDFIKKFANGIKIDFECPIKEKNLKNAIYYCKLVFENPILFTKKEKDNAAEYICDKYFNNINYKDWNIKILNKLDLFEYNDLKNHLSLENLDKFYNQLSLSDIEIFMRISKFMPREVYKLLKDLSKKKNYEGGVKIIKRLNLPYDNVPMYFIDEKIYKFFGYKIATCKDENNPFNLIEYCLISQKTLDISILQLLQRYTNNKNSHSAQFYLYVINELYYRSYDRRLKISKKIKRRIEDLFDGIKYIDNYTFKDYFGPIEKNSYQINSNKTKVLFIDNVYELENALKTYFVNSKYIGIDSEWQQSFSIKEEVEVSIIQLSTDDEKCCIILDMLSLKYDKNFYDIFKKYFTGKIFVGFSLDKSDLMVFPPELNEFFGDANSCTIYDLCIIYNQKYLKKCSCLKVLTEELLGQNLCKYEQCSDWNLRPLSLTKLHYAALDALICIILFKKMLKEDNPLIQNQSNHVNI